MTKEAIEASLATLELWGIISFALLVLSTFGQFIVHYKTVPLNKRLHEISKTENLILQESIERLRASNLELEKAASPRLLEQHLSAKRLEVFSNISFLVVASEDFETKRAAGQIRVMLDQAGWKRFDGPIDEKEKKVIWNGVFVHSGFANEETRNGLDELIAILNENGIEAKKGPPVPSLNESTLLIVVGPKPLPKSLIPDLGSLPADENGNKFGGSFSE